MQGLSEAWLAQHLWPSLPQEYADPEYEDRKSQVRQLTRYSWFCYPCKTQNMFYRFECRNCSLPSSIICGWKNCNLLLSRRRYLEHLYSAHLLEHFSFIGTLKCEWKDCTYSTKRVNHLESHIANHVRIPFLICKICKPHFFVREKEHVQNAAALGTTHPTNINCFIRPRIITHRNMQRLPAFPDLNESNSSSAEEGEEQEEAPLVVAPLNEETTCPPSVFTVLPPISHLFNMFSEDTPAFQNDSFLLRRRTPPEYVVESGLFHPGQEQEIHDLFRDSFKSVYDSY